MTKLETLKEMLNEAIRESNKLAKEKDRLFLEMENKREIFYMLMMQ